MNAQQLRKKYAETIVAHIQEGTLKTRDRKQIVDSALDIGFIETCNALDIGAIELERLMKAEGCKQCEECGDFSHMKAEIDDLGNPVAACNVCGHHHSGDPA